MTQTDITGIDYLTGAERPLSALNFVTKDEDIPPDSSVFVHEGPDFALFAALFCKKFGVASDARPPVVVSDESLETIRDYYGSGMTLEL